MNTQVGIPGSYACKMVRAFEALAHEANWRNGTCVVHLCRRQLSKVEITSTISCDISPTRRQSQVDRENDSVRPTVGGPVPVDMEAFTRQTQSTLMSHLFDSDLEFGTLRFELKEGIVSRVNLDIPHLKTEWELLDRRLVGFLNSSRRADHRDSK